MTVTLLYFAAVRDLTGISEEELALPTNISTIAELAAFLPSRHAALAGRLAAVRFARNEMFALANEAIAEGDVIALIPPVAGGS